MFNLTSSVPKSWQTVSRQADRATADQAGNEAPGYNPVHHHSVRTPVTQQTHPSPSRDLARDLGSVLRERREAMGASLAEVETATRIRQKYLAALESDEWRLLPGEVVGRGFLRNYATYLGLDPTEVVERRRAVADPQLAAALYGTSAGSALPPERDIDYRPKDVLLKDEPEGIQQRELRAGPYMTGIAVLGALLLIWWLASNWGSEISTSVSSMLAAAQDRVNAMRANTAAISTPDAPVAGQNSSTPIADQSASNPAPQGGENGNVTSGSIANTQSLPTNPVVQNTPAQPAVAAPNEPPAAPILVPTDTPPAPPPDALASVPVVTDTIVIPPTSTPEIAPSPTDTPLPPPTNTPLPTPTNTPEPTPTEAPAVVAPVCSDSRLAFFSPGVGQVLSGAVTIMGRATHENPDYYKLEYAVGANAEGGYVYFAGDKGQVDGGILGTLNTAALPNGEYTIQLTVVDLTGNFPPPCRVSIVIQN